MFDAYALRDLLRFSGGKKVIDYFRGMDADGSGEITRSSAQPSQPRHVHATNEQADSAFEALDTDQSGRIDYLELDKRLRRMGDRPEPTIPPLWRRAQWQAEAEAVSRSPSGK